MRVRLRFATFYCLLLLAIAPLAHAQSASDITVTKTDSPDPVVAGSNITYTIPITNNGPNPVGNVLVADIFPPGTTYVSYNMNPPPSGSVVIGPGGFNTLTQPIAVGGTVTLTLVLSTTGVPVGTMLTNSVTVSSTGNVDPVPGNDTATATTTVGAPAVPTLSEAALLVFALALACLGFLRAR